MAWRCPGLTISSPVALERVLGIVSPVKMTVEGRDGRLKWFRRLFFLLLLLAVAYGFGFGDELDLGVGVAKRIWDRQTNAGHNSRHNLRVTSTTALCLSIASFAALLACL